MNEREILAELAQLAAEAGLRVQPVRGASGSDSDPVAASAVCRARGETWVVLVGADGRTA